MPFETDQIVLLGFFRERIFQFLCGQAERDIHGRARFGRRVAAVESPAFVDRRVDQIRFPAIGLLDLRQATELLRPLEDKPHHVNGKRGRRVMQGAAGGQGFVIEHHRQVFRGALEHVIANNDNGRSGRPGILLRAGIQQRVPGNVDRAADEIRGGVADKGNACRGRGLLEEFHTVDGLVRGEVQIGGVRVQVKAGGQALEAFLLGVSCRARRAELLGFLDRGFAPRARHDVVRRSACCTQVHGQHCKL